ncbi:MAG TPA: 4-hydroxythreonine-4-phosphate dehydrogenase PdxA [Pyrinomonadaceae bacterium]|nr:4-hydroxythreonine-4-phosphate dehydrogenase PdxA [Pyrinomonadaceae bacterium]
MAERARIAITIGDAAGIGPEIVLRALAEMKGEALIPVVVGDLKFLRRTAEALGIETPLRLFEGSLEASDGETIFVEDLGNLPDAVTPGVESANCGRAAGQYIERAAELWRRGEADAIATAPINKHTLNLGGYDQPGHTEFLAELTGTREFAMSFFGGDLRVVLLSTHVPLTRAIELVKKDAVAKLIRFTSRALADLLGRPVKLAVAGLNPHASEGGMFGTEEADEIEPAIAECRAEGIDVTGPFSPDTIFLRAHRGEFDGVIACYHDQATIAVKSLAFGSAVNVTLGLPLIRTSVDHGTAFDIAGKGIADASSMKAAIRMAAELARTRRAGAAQRSS